MNINPFGLAGDIVSWKFKAAAAAIAAAIVAATVLGIVAWIQHGKSVARTAGVVAGRAEVQTKWDKERREQDAADLAAAHENAVESTRRQAKQQENQNAQNEQVARARADAERDRRERDELRRDHETAAQKWSRRLADSPTAADLAAAGDAIRMCTDVLGRADKRASVLAEVADARGAAGLKCERDYDALNPSR
jgi:hypothetical protein